MNIKNVVIINDFNFVQGGASKVAIDTAKLLNEHGIKVYFFSAVNKVEDNINNIEYISTNQKEALKERNKIKGIINGIYNFKAKKELKKLLRTLDPASTVIHIHGWTKALSCSVFDIAFKMNYKVVVTIHDYFSACPNGGYFNYKKNLICNLYPLSWKCIKCNCDSRNYAFKIYRIIRQFVQNKLVKINSKISNAITISELSENVIKRTLSDKVKITRIYNPIELKMNNKKIDFEKNKYFLYVGRVSKEKGVELFCKAISDNKLEGIVVGDGDEKEGLQNRYKNIKFTGWKNKSEVEEYMKNARALVFPSQIYETAGLTILEAQAVGLPCIVYSKCAGREFVKEGENGYLFNNLEDLKEKLKSFDLNYAMNRELDKYSTNNYIEKIIKLYNEMLK